MSFETGSTLLAVLLAGLTLDALREALAGRWRRWRWPAGVLVALGLIAALWAIWRPG